MNSNQVILPHFLNVIKRKIKTTDKSNQEALQISPKDFNEYVSCSRVVNLFVLKLKIRFPLLTECADTFYPVNDKFTTECFRTNEIQKKIIMIARV